MCTERYIRDDIAYGYLSSTSPATCVSSLDSLVSHLSSSSYLLVLDANVLRHNIDLLSSSSFRRLVNVVVPMTALEEIQSFDRGVTYKRVIEACLLDYSSTVDEEEEYAEKEKEKEKEKESSKSGVAAKPKSKAETAAAAAPPPVDTVGIFFPDLYSREVLELYDVLKAKHYSSSSSSAAANPAASAAASAASAAPALSSVNDRNDLTIRSVASYFAVELASYPGGLSTPSVVLLTNDKDCARRSVAEQASLPANARYSSMSVRDFVSRKDISTKLCAALRDTVGYAESEEDSTSSSSSSSSSSSAASRRLPSADLYPSHLVSDSVLSSVRNSSTTGIYQGVLRCSRTNFEEGSVTITRRSRPGATKGSSSSAEDERVSLKVQGMQRLNRGVDGDVVAVCINNFDEWEVVPTEEGAAKGESPPPPPAAAKGSKPSSGASVPDATQAPTESDLSNVADADSGGVGGALRRRPTARVVGIVRRNFRRDYCGGFVSASAGGKGGDEWKTQNPDDNRAKIAREHEQEHADGTSTLVFFAVDARIPPILVRTAQRDALIGKRILVSIDEWPATSAFPLGHFVKVLGKAGDKSVETEVLLHEFDIPTSEFTAKVMSCLPDPESFEIKMEEGRLDLRHLPVVSIDPPGCKDIDDALHCTVLPNGNWQVGVHIADVTHYVPAGCPLDAEAARRSTSTYLVARRLDMLPGLLTTDLCSLKSKVDRYAFSVLWEVTPDAAVVNVEFKKSVIHSVASLTYQQGQNFIDMPAEEARGNVVAEAVKRLVVLSRKFRKKRLESGALTLASPEVKFVLDDESLNPTDVQSYTLYEANELVEEFMLLANVTVGKKILRQFPTLCVLRRHPAPHRSMFDTLISKARSRGFELDIDDSKKLADSLDAAVDPADPYFNKLLRILSTRCMSPAQYFCSGDYRPQDWHHFGLATPVYTHFTSPIRRYADVCVHRLLAASIGHSPLPLHLSSKSILHDLCENMNRRHRAAQLAGRASVNLHTVIFFAGEPREEDGYILDVASEGEDGEDVSLTIMVPRYGIEGTAVVDKSGGKQLVRESEHSIVFQGEKLKVFDRVRVRINVVEVQGAKELKMHLLGRATGEPSSANADDEEMDVDKCQPDGGQPPSKRATPPAPDNRRATRAKRRS